ncbi:uncharacterized protein B0H18DRAFT_1085842 [Fomitopsis serialis]|uniref:uncharacterized protein n=1 Tax=Fomitopsis serialis TaxID=139415 RepID=UPI002008DB40|nr:uncharacterized protein B0H18DRAFT_1085842 [Neoantrodia serialis]KAH9922647.1 hypothetical protein B0H18DRAFT_1085842 [Neoantrodia serialis]
MSNGLSEARPAWQTDELEDEWIDQEATDDSHATRSMHAHSSSDISFTQPLGSVIVRSSELRADTPAADQNAGGTFLIREDAPAVPLLPKTPGRGKKAFGKDFFSPLALERMFEPPSPPGAVQATAPSVPSRLSRDTEIIGELSRGDIAVGEGGDGQEVQSGEAGVLDCQFTFEAPRPSPFNPNGVIPAAQSTPGHPRMHSDMLNPPSTDPRLRLFQFQYDTFTRDHLSAMVDSIAVNTPSAGSGAVSSVRLRSAKRIKLSPASEISRSGDGEAMIHRPRRKDYVGESKSLMDKIRRARDFSTVSTVASARSPEQADASVSRLTHACLSRASGTFISSCCQFQCRKTPSPSWTVASSQRGVYSSLGYREQAANLMAQIRSDMKGSKRIFSEDTEPSHITADETSRRDNAAFQHEMPSRISTARRGSIQIRDAAHHTLTGTTRGKRKLSPPPYDSDEDTTDIDDMLADGITHMSLDSQRLLEQFPDPPVRLTVTAEDAPPASTIGGTQSRSRPESNPTFLALPLAARRDLTRFVSSSTASGTTLTQGSAASFVKHPGPKQITRIAPEDVPTLPDRVGKMVFDKVMMKWVKDTAAATAGMAEAERRLAVDTTDGNESEDPFRDIESLREEDDSGDQPTHAAVVVERDHDEDAGEESLDTEDDRFQEIDEATDVEDEEEIELTSFSFDGPPAGQDESEGSEITESDGEDDEEVTDTADLSVPAESVSGDSEGDYNADQAAADSQPQPALQDTPPHHLVPQSYATSSLTTPNARAGAGAGSASGTLRSALKSSSITPVSALKDPNKNKTSTPAARLGRRRSVSFSDGKRDGPIRGIGRNVPTPVDPEGTEDEDDSPLVGGTNKAGSVLVPSARSKRIADMLDNLEDPAGLEDDSPSRASSLGRPQTEELQPLKARRPSSAKASPGREVSRRVFSRPHSKTPSSAGRNANATFLTECSFGVAHDRLVQVITDVQPFEPYWEDLTSIDLSARNIDSVARLKDNHNQLSWLSGIPGTVRSLSVVSNVLTGLTSFSHLLNIEYLDLSRNQITSLRQLACLRHLRELRADGNRIDSVDGLQKMDGLVKLSLQGNVVQSLDLQDYRWTRLEMLNVSHNRVSNVSGLASAPALVALNLDNNALDELDRDGTMPRLRILRVSGNRLKQLDASAFPGLRTLYADNNYLGTIHKAHRLIKLENLSLRNQGGKPGLLSWNVSDLIPRLCTGNPLKGGFIAEPCYHLVYLELAACRLTALPTGLARLIPNVRVLNLNYNFVEDPRPLEGLTRLRKLTLIGSRIKNARLLARVLRGMTDIEMLDFRYVRSLQMNPCTLGWYLPILVRDVPGALQPSDGDRPGPSSGGNALAGFAAPVRGPASQAGGSAHDHLPTGHRARDGAHSHGPQQSSIAGSAGGANAPARGGAEAAASPGGHGDAAGGHRAGTGEAPPRAQSGPPPVMGSVAGSASGAAVWKELDAKFRRDLPDDVYLGRLAYRGLVMRACPGSACSTAWRRRQGAREGGGRAREPRPWARSLAAAAPSLPNAGDAQGGLTREKEKTKTKTKAKAREGVRAGAQ